MAEKTPRNQGVGGGRRKTHPRSPNLFPVLPPSRTEIDDSNHYTSSTSVVSNTSSSTSKVAIPRLPKAELQENSSQSAASGLKHRVNHACEPCRVRKTKCSGERPTCRHCEDFGLGCFYEDGKRDKRKRMIRSMQNKVDSYKALVAGMGAYMDSQVWRSIERSMNLIDYNDEDTRVLLSPFTKPDNGSDLGRKVVVNEPSKDIQAANDILNGSHHAIIDGYGQRTDFSTGENLKGGQNLGWTTTRPQPQKTSNIGTNRTAFQNKALNPTRAYDHNLLFDVATEPDPLASRDWIHQCDINNDSPLSYNGVDSYFRSPSSVTLPLIDAYFDSVHATFPIIRIDLFRSQVGELFDDDTLGPPNADWLTILNLVLAISSKYVSAFRNSLGIGKKDHQIYFARAYSLRVTGEYLLSLPSVEKVQIAGLMSIYFLCTNQFSRAYTTCAISISDAQALGLHSIDKNVNIKEIEKETHYRLWWALYALDQTISTITGHPTSVNGRACSAPLPMPLNERLLANPSTAAFLRCRCPSQDWLSDLRSCSVPSRMNTTDRCLLPVANFPFGIPEVFSSVEANSSTYFLCNVQLHNIAQVFIANVRNYYACDELDESIWSLLPALNDILLQWRSVLPNELNFASSLEEDNLFREKMSLGFTFYSTVISLNRIGLDYWSAPKASTFKEYSAHGIAKVCGQAARDMLDLLPLNSDFEILCQQGPWWCLTFYLMQAISVLVQEFSLRHNHISGPDDATLKYVQRTITWLRCISVHSERALHAWRHAIEMMGQIVAENGKSADELLSESQLTAPTHEYGSGLNYDSEESGKSISAQSRHELPVQVQPESSFPAAGYSSYGLYEDTNDIYGNMDGLDRMDVYPVPPVSVVGNGYQYHPHQRYQE